MRKVWNVQEMGASGSGNTNDTEIIQKAIELCSMSGGVVYFPKGIYTSGTLFIKSNVTIYLEKCAVLQAICDEELFPMIEHNVLCTVTKGKWKAFLYAFDEENITITGDGTISPRGDYEIFQNRICDFPDRPFGIHFVRCRNININGIKLLNSAFWMQRYFECEDLRLNGLHVFNHCNLNNDGVDIDSCKRVFVSDCYIDSSDDALCFKSHGEQACEDIVVSNCIFSSHATAIKFGTGSVAGFKRINITNCIIKPSIAPHVAHQMNLKAGLSGIDIIIVDGGIVDNINIDNVSMDGVETPIFMKIGTRNSRVEGMTIPIVGEIKNVRLSNINAQNVGPVASSITGCLGFCLENISLYNVNIELSKSNHKDMPPAYNVYTKVGEYSKLDNEKLVHLDFSLKEEVPENEKHYPCSRLFNTILPAYGFFVRHVNNITFNNVKISTTNKDDRKAYVLDDVTCESDIARK